MWDEGLLWTRESWDLFLLKMKSWDEMKWPLPSVVYQFAGNIPVRVRVQHQWGWLTDRWSSYFMVKTVSGERTWQGNLGHKLNLSMLHEIMINTVNLDFTSHAGALPGLFWAWQPEGHCYLLSSTCVIFSHNLFGSLMVWFISTCHLEWWCPLCSWVPGPSGPIGAKRRTLYGEMAKTKLQ